MGLAENVASAYDTTANESRATRPRRWWTIAHTVWIFGVFVNAVIFFSELPLYYQNLLTPCISANPGQDCNTGQLAPRGIAALSRVGVSFQTYVTIAFAVIILQSLIFFTIAALIVWRRWNQGLGLFVSMVLITFGATGSSDTLLDAYQVLQHQLNPTVSMFSTSLRSLLPFSNGQRLAPFC